MLFSHQDISNSLQPHGLYLAHQAPLSSTISWSLLRFISIELVMPSNHLILCCPLFLCLQSFPASGSSPELAICIRWPKYWSFSSIINPSSEYSGLISFRIDWFDLLAVQGALRSLLQHPNSTASILQPSAFFMVQRSHPYLSALHVCLVVQSCLTLCDHMDCSLPGSSVHGTLQARILE